MLLSFFFNSELQVTESTSSAPYLVSGLWEFSTQLNEQMDEKPNVSASQLSLDSILESPGLYL